MNITEMEIELVISTLHEKLICKTLKKTHIYLFYKLDDNTCSRACLTAGERHGEGHSWP